MVLSNNLPRLRELQKETTAAGEEGCGMRTPGHEVAAGCITSQELWYLHCTRDGKGPDSYQRGYLQLVTAKGVTLLWDVVAGMLDGHTPMCLCAGVTGLRVINNHKIKENTQLGRRWGRGTGKSWRCGSRWMWSIYIIETYEMFKE